MTEAEWLTCTRWDQMLDSSMLGSSWSEATSRKGRLFACACCRRIWPLITDNRSRRAVEIAEAFAAGITGADELGQARGDADFYTDLPDRSDHVATSTTLAASETCGERFAHAAGFAASAVFYSLRAATGDEDGSRKAEWAEVTHQTILFRDISGNPFRPVTAEATWRTPAVTAFAQFIYDERAFERMPDLADLLERAGCKDLEIPQHCRGSGPHVRGCWVIDLILGKE